MSDGELDRSPVRRAGFFRAGGWVVVLALVVSLAVLGWGIVPIVRSWGSHGLGDGTDPESYGFVLEPLLAPREALSASGMPRDGIRALVDPPALPAALANDREALGVLRGKYLVPSQRVIGVVIGGEARAYPLRVLNWHEVVNDELGGRPIAVTYSPLTDSATVWDRRLDHDQPRVFGVSGLLLDSNTLLYDRGAPGQESLWTQFTGRAVAGPAAAERRALDLVPAVVEPWGAWVERHPETTVLKPDPAHFKLYRRDPYGAYYGDARLRFPVDPPCLPGEPSCKDRVLAVSVGGNWWVFSFDSIARREEATVLLDGIPVTLSWYEREPSAVARTAEGRPLPAVSGMWFAWNALVRTVGPPGLRAEPGHSHRREIRISRSAKAVLNYRLIRPHPAVSLLSSGLRPLSPNADGKSRPAGAAG